MTKIGGPLLGPVVIVEGACKRGCRNEPKHTVTYDGFVVLAKTIIGTM